MTFRQTLLAARDRLRASDSPYLDALVLLAHATGVKKERLLAALPEEVDEITAALFEEFLRRRISGEPVAYIRNRKEFWGLEFYVDARVLIPRPDTEILVESALALIDTIAGSSGKPVAVHDACTGSGCIGISLKRERPDLAVSLSDISRDALQVAGFNSSSLLTTPLQVYESDLLAGIDGSFDIITCNPPYVEHDYLRPSGGQSETREPLWALDGGADGYTLIPKLLEQALDRLRRNGYLVVEASPSLVPRMAAEMAGLGYRETHSINDLAGRPRVAVGRRL